MRAKDWAETLLKGHRKGPLPPGERERVLNDPNVNNNGTARYMGAEQRKRGIRYRMRGVTEEAESVTESVTVTEKALPLDESVTALPKESNAPLTPAEKQRRYRERKKAERDA